MRKIKLQYTPHMASYDIEQKTVTICGSREEKIDMLPKVIHLTIFPELGPFLSHTV